MHPGQFRELVIRPTLERLGMAGLAAEQLLLGTALAESELRYIYQVPAGPALGFYQMEPATHKDLWVNYLPRKPKIRERLMVVRYAAVQCDDDALLTDMAYMTAMARINYWRKPDPLPPAGDVLAMARYWKRLHNTHEGKGTIEGFVERAGAYIAS